MAEPTTNSPEIGRGMSVHLDPPPPADKKGDTPDAGDAGEPVISMEHCQKKSGRLLIMDDEEEIRELFSEMFGLKGYTVVTAGDGNEAVRKYVEAMKAGSPFDVTILDLTVRNGMGGKEAMILLRKIDPGIIAIVSSGYHADPIMGEYMQYGFRAVLPKPYAFDKMFELVTRLMMEKR